MTDRPDRLFLGIPITRKVRRDLLAHLEPVEIPGRAVPPENWHLTLRFLGDTSRQVQQQLVQALGAQQLGIGITITFGDLGAFPRAARATVLWVGIRDGGDEMRALSARVEEAVRRAGFVADERPFRPHLTLSRIQPARDVRRLVERTPPFLEQMMVDSVVLYRSHLGRGPARYEELERFDLGSI